jgi:hypothetical protein
MATAVGATPEVAVGATPEVAVGATAEVAADTVEIKDCLDPDQNLTGSPGDRLGIVEVERDNPISSHPRLTETPRAR